MAYRKDWIQPQVGPMGFAGSGKVIGRTVTLLATDMVTAGTVGAFKVPAGFCAYALVAVASDMDAVTTLTISVGDAALPTRFLNASTIGQTGATAVAFTTPSALNCGFIYTADTEILITCTLQTASPLAGTLNLYLIGYMAQ